MKARDAKQGQVHNFLRGVYNKNKTYTSLPKKNETASLKKTSDPKKKPGEIFFDSH